MASSAWCYVALIYLYGQPCIMYVSSYWRFASTWAAACMSCIDVHTGILTDMLMAFGFMLMPVISWSLFSVWFFWDNQFIMYRSGPGLYIIYTLYWWMCSMMYCNQWDNVATSLPIIVTNGLLSVITYSSLGKQ